jgi:hypothetical protein
VKLLAQVSGDGDLIQAWLDHYLRLGVTSFHLIVHGSEDCNAQLFRLRDSYPIVVEETFEGEFRSEEKQRRLNALLARMRGEWLVLVDSDELLELPYGSLSAAVRMLEFLGANVLYAPMLQRTTADGTLETPERIADPFGEFPLCSVGLYQAMGVKAALSKYPLFRCAENTFMMEGGNHHSPNGSSTVLAPIQGVTHHFKWRRTVAERLRARAESEHTWRHQSVGFLAYLEQHGRRVPVQDAFPYSRGELFRRGLLCRAPKSAYLKAAARRFLAYWPVPVQAAIRRAYAGLRHGRG